MREWPMFRRPAGKRQSKGVAHEGRAPPHMSELIMMHVPGTPVEKLDWLRQQKAANKLDGDDPEEISQAEALLVMLTRLSGSKERNWERHLDELLDEGLRETFPASDPVSVGRFTSTEPPARPLDRTVGNLRAVRKSKNPPAQRPRMRNTG
jgi:hypothetical protein